MPFRASQGKEAIVYSPFRYLDQLVTSTCRGQAGMRLYNKCRPQIRVAISANIFLRQQSKSVDSHHLQSPHPPLQSSSLSVARSSLLA